MGSCGFCGSDCDERGDENGETRNAGVMVYVCDVVAGERGYGNVICGGVMHAGVCHASHGVRGAGPCGVRGAGPRGVKGAGPGGVKGAGIRGVIGAGRVGGRGGQSQFFAFHEESRFL